MSARKYIWVAEFETHRYSFVGYGRSKEEAKQAILNEWINNNWNCYFRTDIQTIEELDAFSTIYAHRVTLGDCEVL